MVTQFMPWQLPASPQFQQAVKHAIALARQSPRDDIRYAVEHVPIYTQYFPDPIQQQVSGCVGCTYLGLWASEWPGYAPSPHGIIWIFEWGVTKVAVEHLDGNVAEQAYCTLIHELEHALQLDHVLDAMRVQQAAALALPGTAPYGRRP